MDKKESRTRNLLVTSKGTYFLYCVRGRKSVSAEIIRFGSLGKIEGGFKLLGEREIIYKQELPVDTCEKAKIIMIREIKSFEGEEISKKTLPEN